MNRWQQKFDEHPIHETLKQLESYVSKQFDDIKEDETQERRRFLKIISTYQELLSELDPELVPINQLDTLNAGLRHQNIWNQVASYSGNQNSGHLVHANDHLSNQLTQLSLLLAIAKKTKFIKPLKKVETLVDDFSQTISSQKTKLQLELKELTDSLNTNKQELVKLEQLIETRKNEADRLMSQWQSQFSESQERRNTEYANWSKKLDEQAQEELELILKKSDSELASHQKLFEEKIKEIIDDGNEKHQAILELYELTAGDSVGAGYIKNADNEMKQANIWRRISIGFISLTVVWLGFVYFCNAGAFEFCKIGVEDFWAKIITAFSLTGVMLYGAAYSSQQSTKHRNNEKRARWFALEIKAFDPFISSLQEEQRHELKKQLSERLFGQNEHNNVKDSKIIDEHAYKTVIDGIVNVISKIPKGG
ncbi:MAG: hypothetical protein FAF04_00580 [Epsilonproteobacteria bacterium]|nr:hypothetical protein [Campylobacterota bacterium]